VGAASSVLRVWFFLSRSGAYIQKVVPLKI